MELKVLKNPEVRKPHIDNAKRTAILLDKDVQKFVKNKAFDLDTTTSEILRSIIEFYLKNELKVDTSDQKSISFKDGEQTISLKVMTIQEVRNNAKEVSNVQIYLNKEVINQLKKEAIDLGTTMSEVVRALVNWYVQSEE